RPAAPPWFVALAWAGQRNLGARCGGRDPDRHELDRLLGVAIAVTGLVLDFERLTELLRVGPQAAWDRELERLPAVAHLIGRLQLGLLLANGVSRAVTELAHGGADGFTGHLLATEQERPLHVTPALRDDQPDG